MFVEFIWTLRTHSMCLSRIRDTTGKQCPFVQKGLRLLVGIPQSPENCPADRLRTRPVWHFLLPPFCGNKKEGRQQSHDCHLPIDHRYFLILFFPAVVPALHQSLGNGRYPVLRSGSSSSPSWPCDTPHKAFAFLQGCCRTRKTNPLRAEVS